MNDRDEKGVRTAAYWREKAEETRALADEMSDKSARATMQSVADLYDQMADRTEFFEKQNV